MKPGTVLILFNTVSPTSSTQEILKSYLLSEGETVAELTNLEDEYGPLWNFLCLFLLIGYTSLLKLIKRALGHRFYCFCLVMK